jgi:hypothetical protein
MFYWSTTVLIGKYYNRSPALGSHKLFPIYPMNIVTQHLLLHIDTKFQALAKAMSSTEIK